jgi:DNA-binding GntR family transcriptional regulator
VVNALTAQSVRERFKLREILEPEALRLAAETTEYDRIAEALQRERERDHGVQDPGAGVRLDNALMIHCLMRAPNRHLVELIEQNRLPLAAASRALTKLGLPDDAVATSEYLVLFELIAGRAIEAAATYWRNHLATLAKKNLARLKIVAVFPDPPVDVPYLTRRDA